MDEEGRVYHLALKKGELANRILCVGDPQRALLLSSLLETVNLTKESNRGFTVYTGTYGGVPLSIVSIGMGLAMVDFFIREGRQILDGPMYVIRLGTCGTTSRDIKSGSMVVANEAICIQADYEAQLKGVDLPFRFTKPITGDPNICSQLTAALKASLPEKFPTYVALDITADTFYAAQGRRDPNFRDKNERLMDYISENYPNAGSFQMETYGLFHLAALCTKPVYTGACAIVLAQRQNNQFLDFETKHFLEKAGGKACLEVLKKCKVPENYNKL